MPMTNRTPHHQSGFTVVVIAALFIAFSIIAAAAVERNTIVRQITMRDSARDQLKRISNAVITFAVKEGGGGELIYPCPADITATIESSGFGISKNTAGTQDCYDTGLDPITGIPSIATDLIRGMVPVATLSAYGLTSEDAFDPWGNRIMYVVNRTQTIGGTPSQTNNPTLWDKRNNLTIEKPDFIIISYGRDGVGATRRNTSITVSCAAAETTANKENCDNDIYFITAPTYTAPNATNTTVGNPPNANPFVYNTYFDDILVWYRQ